MTRKYPFFTRIAYVALFWNSVGPIYSAKNVANQRRCLGGIPVELNLLVPFRIEKAHFSEKKFSRPQTNFRSGKKVVSVVLITNEWSPTVKTPRTRHDPNFVAQCNHFLRPFHVIILPRSKNEWKYWNTVKKIEVELCTFPDSTNTETPRKVFFFCFFFVCVCKNVCQWISYQVDRFQWKFRCKLQLACNREPRLASTIGPIFPQNLGGGGCVFLQFFRPLNLKKCTNNKYIVKLWNLKTYKFDPICIFSVSIFFW